MKDIVNFEKKRSISWAALFILISLGLVVVIGGALLAAAQIIGERESLDMLMLLREDPETVSEFWGDMIFVIWEEFPFTQVVLLFVGLVTFIYFVLATRDRRSVVVKRLEHILRWS